MRVKGVTPCHSRPSCHPAIVPHTPVLCIALQVDVEGFESIVLRSASALFNKRNVANIVLEYNAGGWCSLSCISNPMPNITCSSPQREHHFEALMQMPGIVT